MKRKNLRSEMVFMSVFIGAAGTLANPLWYLKDWWQPEYLFSGVTLVEDFLLGFATGGILSIVYEEIFNFGYTRSLQLRKIYTISIKRFIFLITISALPMLILFNIFGVHSFWANIIGLSVGAIFILLRRPDLTKDVLFTAIALPLLVFPAFWIPELLSPDWIKVHWLWENLSGRLIAGVPLEDLIWYFFVGLFGGGFYEYVFGLRLKGMFSPGRRLL